MSKKIKLALAALICIPLTFLATVAIKSRMMLAAMEPVALHIPARDEAPGASDRGRHLAHAVLGCKECHGDDLGGKLYIDAMPFGRFVGPNLTRGAGGLGADYTDADWVRAIQHGLRRDHTPIPMMPSESYAQLSDADMSALLVYLRGLAPIDRTLPKTQLGPIGALAIAAGEVKVPARSMDHGRRAAARADGAYLVEISGCTRCHGEDLKGRSMGGDNPDAPDISKEALAGWTREGFARALREGVSPDGRTLNPLMPYASMKELRDEEVDALWRFIRGE